jgi:hypothetical protein
MRMQVSQIQRWRASLVVVTLTGLVFALVSGSVLLFLGYSLERRDYWELAHWTLALVGLVPYAVYQLRHYLRVREFAQTTHYRVGLQAFFMICGALLTGLPLITPLERGTPVYSTVDLAHMFFGFVFVILLSAHLTLVGLLTVARAPAESADTARAAVKYLFAVASVLTIGVVIAVIAMSRFI